MSKYFDENLPWTEEASSKEGLPRPYVDVPEDIQKINPPHLKLKKSFYLHKRVPMPFTARPRLVERLTDLIVENEKRAVKEGLCPYCARKFFPDDEAVIMTKVDAIPHMLGDIGPRVFSDHFPIHPECIKQARIFCPFLRVATTDADYLAGKYLDLVKISMEYKQYIEEKVLPFIQLTTQF